MRDFKDYIWEGMRKGIVQLWLILVLLSALSYSGVIIVLKNKELASGLKVASYTVNEALKAGDWPLAIGHLGALEAAGPVYDIRLKRQVGSTVVTGPFGQPAWGFGSLCQEAKAGPELMVSGCMRIFGPAESTTLVLFLAFASLVFFVVFIFFRGKMLYFINSVSKEIKDMSHLSISDGKTTKLQTDGKISEIYLVKKYILGLLKEREASAHAVAVSKLSAQVAHDIRSPLTALDSLLSDVSQIPEEKRVLLRKSISRIHDIANNLLERNRDKKTVHTFGAALLSTCVTAIVSEKRYQYESLSSVILDFETDVASAVTFVKIDPNEFKRLLSNLIDNAVEALNGSGKVKISLISNENRVHIEIDDNGNGIPEKLLPSLGQIGITSKKGTGSGLGVYHAKTTIESWGGAINISSQLGKGTRVNCSLPLSEPPKWFASEIEIPTKDTLVILDDDETIHITWQNRLPQSKLLHFYNAEDFERWLVRNKASHFFCLIDFELIGSAATGLDLIVKHDLVQKSILVTSHFEEQDLIEKCTKLAIKLLPKNLASSVRLKLEESFSETVLIDDDDIVRLNWESAAKKSGNTLKTYESVSAFLSDVNHFTRFTPIYIDSSLGNGIKGEIAAKEIQLLGFNDIYLTTGYDPKDFSEMPWIREVIGKEPPWKNQSDS